jgi:CheY-specific phosphatase CheX
MDNPVTPAAPDPLADFLRNEYYAVFKKAMVGGLKKISKADLTYGEEYISGDEYISKGLAAVVGITGGFSGQMTVNLPQSAADMLAFTILKKKPENGEEITAILAEFANIVAGNACSELNKKEKALKLRVIPPTVLAGENMVVIPPGFITRTAVGDSIFGKIILNVGFSFAKGDTQWISNT